MGSKSVFGLVVLLFVVGCYEPSHDKGTECSHKFTDWGTMELTQDWSHGPRFWQSRTCTECGFAEIRTVKP
jgi:hypothetical protein